MAKVAKKTAEESAMAKNEKHNDGTMTGLKKTLIGTVSTLVVGGGTFLMSYLQKPKESDKQVQPQSINITVPGQQTTSTKTVIVKEKSNEAKQINKPQPKTKKKDGDEFKEEAPKW